MYQKYTKSLKNVFKWVQSLYKGRKSVFQVYTKCVPKFIENVYNKCTKSVKRGEKNTIKKIDKIVQSLVKMCAKNCIYFSYMYKI